jgi:DNA-binding transcriptional ArsR family regulator
MVECNLTLDRIFASLADATRRDMLRLLRRSRELSIGQIAAHYSLTFAGIAKHLKVLEQAGLVKKRRAGKQQMVQIAPKTIAAARSYLDQYGEIINERYDRLDALLAGRRS